MPIEEIGAVVLPRGSSADAIAFTNNGSGLLIGTRADGEYEARGVLWANWRTGASQTVSLPPQGFPPDHEFSGLGAHDVDGQTAVVLTGVGSGGLTFEAKLWLVHRDGGTPPRLIRHAPDGGVVFALSSDRAHLLVGDSFSKQPQLDVIALSPFAPRLSVPLPAVGEILDVCLANDLTHFAFATKTQVVCVGADGRELCAWPIERPVYGLAFAEDDLGLWGIAHDAVTLFQWKGSAVPFAVAGMRAWAFDAGTRRATFLGDGTVCALDLATGAAQTLGAFPEPRYLVRGCDVKRQRFAAADLERPGEPVRVFEATDRAQAPRRSTAAWAWVRERFGLGWLIR